MDYGFHIAVTSWSDKVAADMAALAQRGVNSFKFFMAYKGALMVNDEQLLQGFRRCKELGAVPQVHAENGDAVAEGQQRVFDAGITGPEGHALSRPPELEGEATARAIRLAEFVGSPLYVVHVMSRDAQEEIARARQRGQRVIGETVASAVSMDESRMWHPDFNVAAQYVMSPPIRSKEHGAALRSALAGGLLQLVGTDHAVFNSTQKAVGRHDFRIIPNGVNGLEERMHVVWQEMVNSGLLSPSDFVRVTSTVAAQIFNVYPRKGVVAEGSDADVIIFDPSVKHTISAKAHYSAMDTNIYEGYAVTGKVVTTVSRGRVVWHDGKLNVTRGSGRFVPTPPFGPLYDGLDRRSPYLLDVARYGGVPGLLDNPWLKSGIISGSLSLAGDVLAQLLTLRGQQQQGSSSSGGYDVARAARMGSFGLLFYGPYQNWWYGLLARTFPGTSIPMFATKARHSAAPVALNQLCLAPITITVAFTWNLALTGQLDQLPGKLRRDFVRTMINGWRFWVPAATINFKLVPLQYQVLYMSTCGMLWTGYLSYQSAAAQAK
ncbi:hypothetical protein COHA_000773 [Chlorella ohadii]|uniref:dihydropyrimidinase n=1 Tax=Chlorella ohadii TaxID=2649997 RepID=A0AAD5H624_9CHLO|nr:hypothetical protein COHA_000773 [Chlorella ohadii]